VKSSSAKDKGRRLQQMAVGWILNRWTGLHKDDVRSQSMGARGEDVPMSPKARSKFPFSIECKFRERINVYKFYQQAVDNAGDHQPALIIKSNHKVPLIVLDAEWFINNWNKSK